MPLPHLVTSNKSANRFLVSDDHYPHNGLQTSERAVTDYTKPIANTKMLCDVTGILDIVTSIDGISRAYSVSVVEYKRREFNIPCASLLLRFAGCAAREETLENMMSLTEHRVHENLALYSAGRSFDVKK